MKKKRWLSYFIVLLVALTMIPKPVSAEGEITQEFDLSKKDAVIESAGTYSISGTTTEKTITVNVDSGEVYIILNGVNIDVSRTSDACAFKIADDSKANVTVKLEEGTTNILKSGTNCAGLQKNGNKPDIGKLTITGAGELIATGGDGGAGIGGGNAADGYDITITGGSVKATGGTPLGADIGDIPTDDGNNNVYLAKLENQSGINEVSVDGKAYTRQENHPDDSAFYLYLTKEEHSVVSGTNCYGVTWDDSSNTFEFVPTGKKALTPAFNTSKNASSITLTLTNYDPYFGNIMYKLDDGEWTTSSNNSTIITFSNLKANSSYTIKVYYAGIDDYNGYAKSDIAQANETTSSASYTISIPSSATVGNKEEIKATALDLGGTSEVWDETELRDGLNGNAKEVQLAINIERDEWLKAKAGEYIGSITFTASLQNEE